MFSHTFWILVAWYAFCGILIIAIRRFWNLLSKQKFRDSLGDISTEVGYEEDSMGNSYTQEEVEGSSEVHVTTGAGQNGGTTLMG